MVWRATRCLRPCDRLSNPPSVTLKHLRVERNETSNTRYCLLAEAKSDSMESHKTPEAFR